MTSEMHDKFLQECMQAIRSEPIFHNLSKVAIRMRLADLAQEQASQIIRSAREAVTGTRFFDDTDRDEAISEVLDGVTGYCSSVYYIWSPDYDAKKALADLEKEQS